MHYLLFGQFLVLSCIFSWFKKKIRFLQWQEFLLKFLHFLVQESPTHICVPCMLYEYIWEELKASERRERLFISYIKSHDKEIGPFNISRWIVDTVCFAYNQNHNSSSDKACAHELRALSSSFAWLNSVPMDSVLRAGLWWSENASLDFILGIPQGLRQNFSLWVQLWRHKK